jgi:hypothetical protein
MYGGRGGWRGPPPRGGPWRGGAPMFHGDFQGPPRGPFMGGPPRGNFMGGPPMRGPRPYFEDFQGGRGGGWSRGGPFSGGPRRGFDQGTPGPSRPHQGFSEGSASSEIKKEESHEEETLDIKCQPCNQMFNDDEVSITLLMCKKTHQSGELHYCVSAF